MQSEAKNFMMCLCLIFCALSIEQTKTLNKFMVARLC